MYAFCEIILKVSFPEKVYSFCLCVFIDVLHVLSSRVMNATVAWWITQSNWPYRYQSQLQLYIKCTLKQCKLLCMQNRYCKCLPLGAYDIWICRLYKNINIICRFTFNSDQSQQTLMTFHTDVTMLNVTNEGQLTTTDHSICWAVCLQFCAFNITLK